MDGFDDIMWPRVTSVFRKVGNEGGVFHDVDPAAQGVAIQCYSEIFLENFDPN